MSQQTPNTQKEHRPFVRLVLRHIWQALKKNWGFKVLALLIAIVLWAGLISQDPTLTREKTFTDVTLNVTGADTLKRNGLIVTSDISNLLSGATMWADVPQMQYQAANANNYNARIDLSRIRETGVQSVRVTSTNSSTYGTVKEISPESVQIEVEEYVTRYRIPVTLNIEGQAPDGYYAGAPNLDPPLVAVSGPKSVVDQVVRAEATLDLSTLPAQEGLVRTTAAFKLVDRLGNTVESKLLEVTSESVLLDSVVVEQQLYPMRTLVMSQLGLVTGEPEAGYEVKSITVTPSEVKVAGSSDSIDELDTIYPDGQVDVGGMNESFTQQLRVRKLNELKYVSNDTVTVAVEIGPVIRSRTIDGLRVNLTGVGNGMNATLAVSQAAVTITGPQLFVDTLRPYHLTLSCDASGLTAGTYDLPVICQVSVEGEESYTIEVSPATVQVTLKERT